MLYLHGGLPKTSTTSIQAALFRSRSRLADSGILYPARWRAPVRNERLSNSHLALHLLLKSAVDSPEALGEFRAFLTENANAHVVLSSEGLGLWLHSSQRQEVLLRFLAVAQEAMPTKCVWTLRRHDEVFESLYKAWLSRGRDLPPPQRFVSRDRSPIPRFAGMQRVEEALNGNVAYVRYEPDGSHNRDLLSALGIEGRPRAQIVDELDRRPRQNVGWTHKQFVSLLNTAELTRRAGVELSRDSLKGAFLDDGFSFEEDGPCIVLDRNLRRRMHENTLMRAETHGFSTYVGFFQDVQIDEFPPASRLESAVITDRDLSRLVEHQR